MKRMNAVGLAAAVVVTLAGGAAVLAVANRDATLIRTGSIEVREIDVASKIPGRLLDVRVREGQSVAKGDTLFDLTGREVDARVAQAAAAVDAAHAQWNLSMKGLRAEQVELAERGVEAAQSQYELAEATYRRMKALHDEQLLSDQEHDAIRQKRDAARAALQAANAQLRMAQSGARDEEKAMARGQYDRALQALEEARSYQDETHALAPIAGIVSKRYADPGELMSTGYPVISLMDSRDVWAELNLPETELRYLKVGDRVEGMVNGLGKTATFRVEHIAVMADFANWRAQDDRGSFEVRSFTVTLRPLGRVEGMRPGMTVRFEISER